MLILWVLIFAGVCQPLKLSTSATNGAYVNLKRKHGVISRHSPLCLARTDNLSGGTSQENDLIYYPTPINIKECISDEEMLQKLFLRQISDMNAESDHDYDHEDEVNDNEKFNNSRKLDWNKKLVEEASELVPGCPLEIAYQGRIAFGNFLGMNRKRAKRLKRREKKR